MEELKLCSENVVMYEEFDIGRSHPNCRTREDIHHSGGESRRKYCLPLLVIDLLTLQNAVVNRAPR